MMPIDRGAPNISSPGLWVGFLVGVLVLLAFDLRVASRRHQEQTFKAAVLWSLFWIALSCCFGAWVWWSYGGQQGLEFFAGYMLEKSLSVDNLFVFVLLFRALGCPKEHQHRVLYWGVLGAILMRGAFILAGVALVKHFHWIIAFFGGILVLTGIKLASGGDDDEVGRARVAERAQEDHRRGARLLALPGDGGGLKAVEAGHHHVEEDHGEVLVQEALERLLARLRADHAVSERRQDGLERQEIRRVVVDDQDGGLDGAGLPSRALRRRVLIQRHDVFPRRAVEESPSQLHTLAGDCRAGGPARVRKSTVSLGEPTSAGPC